MFRESLMSDAGGDFSQEASSHYDQTYFKWQRAIGEFGGWANLTKFAKYCEPSFSVLDFGCGGGYLLAKLECREKVGIEVNPAARSQATAVGIRVYASAAEVPDEWADLIISNHALEHCLHPLKELRELVLKLKPRARIVIVVPCESVLRRYRPNDVNHHLYSWSPMNLANLLEEAGYVVEESKAFIHKWPPGHRLIRSIGGRYLFEVACRAYGVLSPAWSQVRAVAHRP